MILANGGDAPPTFLREGRGSRHRRFLLFGTILGESDGSLRDGAAAVVEIARTRSDISVGQRLRNASSSKRSTDQEAAACRGCDLLTRRARRLGR